MFQSDSMTTATMFSIMKVESNKLKLKRSVLALVRITRHWCQNSKAKLLGQKESECRQVRVLLVSGVVLATPKMTLQDALSDASPCAFCACRILRKAWRFHASLVNSDVSPASIMICGSNVRGRSLAGETSSKSMHNIDLNVFHSGLFFASRTATLRPRG